MYVDYLGYVYSAFSGVLLILLPFFLDFFFFFWPVCLCHP